MVLFIRPNLVLNFVLVLLLVVPQLRLQIGFLGLRVPVLLFERVRVDVLQLREQLLVLVLSHLQSFVVRILQVLQGLLVLLLQVVEVAPVFVLHFFERSLVVLFLLGHGLVDLVLKVLDDRLHLFVLGVKLLVESLFLGLEELFVLFGF